ncbi:AAA family ATPase [Saccharopolyspora sp. NPDC000359]|uniref:KGGVGR-motif variant AAA ATPase n=1 Tax=Saccharopolyspora sp. NPDC000359 TaxID=3154251 RepID=UPI0033170C0C
MTTIRFDTAWENVYALADEVSRNGLEVVLVRDLVGRLRLVIDDRGQGHLPANLDDRVRAAAGPFAAATPVLRASEMFTASAVLNSPDLVVAHEADPDSGRGAFSLLERTVVGADWLRPHPAAKENRITLYGFKGGVGRSTATFMLAKHLAEQGLCVLVVDLDLESPGVGELLQPPENRAQHGIVDYLVESAVGNEAGLDLVSRSDIVRPSSGNGEVWLFAADGRPATSDRVRGPAGTPRHRDYLAKLNRIYTEVPAENHDTPHTLAERLEEAVKEAEQQVAERSGRPDVVLIDSRAGIHDIAAIAITRLSWLSLLFASDNQASWTGYRTLFEQWHKISLNRVDDIRRRLRVVAALVPGNNKESYLRSFRENAQLCFAETLYDDTDASDDMDAFSFGPDDEDAPHSPLPILFTSDLVGLNHAAEPGWHDNPFTRAAYEHFLTATTNLIVGEKPWKN